mgnify:CR=1 FL=1
MLFTLVIHAAPHSLLGGTAYNAFQFAQTLLQEGHSIYRLFFYGEGVNNLNAQTITPQGEFNLPGAWQALINEHNIDSVVCIAAALRRGLLDEKEKARHQTQERILASNLLKGSELSGLGQLIEATSKSDRTITFA